jgi:hypothetical protein
MVHSGVEGFRGAREAANPRPCRFRKQLAGLPPSHLDVPALALSATCYPLSVGDTTLTTRAALPRKRSGTCMARADVTQTKRPSDVAICEWAILESNQ